MKSTDLNAVKDFMHELGLDELTDQAIETMPASNVARREWIKLHQRLAKKLPYCHVSVRETVLQSFEAKFRGELRAIEKPEIKAKYSELQKLIDSEFWV
ncbi:MAG: hypothetical protein JJ957_02085 [Pseudomonadales bacterium]|nr:hypothetical protein [Pseudomonadales bacterium]MBO6594601.1 hypothetical protein [Pseudomonadales bacterium]MBO6821838.1 hypothetical protein [Pseudomonadales bacterium]